AGVQDDFNQLRVPFDDSGRVGTLNVRIFQGRITVKAYEGKDVAIEARGRNAREILPPAGDIQGLRRLSTPRGLVATEENNVISLRSERPGNVDLDIQVPSKTNLKLDSMVGGNVLVEGVEGDIEVNNMNGSVTLTEVGGSVVAHSTNGKVLVTMK